MVRTDDSPGAVPARAVEQAGGAVAAHVMKSAHLSVVAADGEEHLADEVEALVVAGVRNLGDVTDDLPGRAEDPLALEREEFRVGVRPGGKAEVVGGSGHDS